VDFWSGKTLHCETIVTEVAEGIFVKFWIVWCFGGELLASYCCLYDLLYLCLFAREEWGLEKEVGDVYIGKSWGVRFMNLPGLGGLAIVEYNGY
jgi:hypothetical protein